MARRTVAPIRFGTSGWRGVLGEEFTFPRLRRALCGVAEHFAEAARSGSDLVVVAHDSRFLGERMADAAVAALAAHGLRTLAAPAAVATPVATRAVRRRRAAGAVVLTASHNPPEYAGLKVFGPGGVGVDDATARRLEARIRRASETEPPAAKPRRADLAAAYRRDLQRRLGPGRFAGPRLRVVYDAMHGMGAGVLDALLEERGARVDVLRGSQDPRFGGDAPDPSPARLGRLAAGVRAGRGLRLGLATDGDADRFAAFDSDGRMLSATEGLALLVDHLARSGRLRRGIAISWATGTLVERVAAAHGLRVTRYPIGFKHLGLALAEGRADVAGEESGGFAWGPFGYDKDGILAGCLFAEIVAESRQPLGARLAQLERLHGRWLCGRAAVDAGDATREALKQLKASPPASVDGAAVERVRSRDGIHLSFSDGFVMLRGSGTEPLLRVYAEAPNQRLLRRRLQAGARLLGASGFSPGSG